MIKIFKQEGIHDSLYFIQTCIGPFAFFNGLESTILRHAMWNGGYFGVIYGVREALPKANVY